MWWHLKVGEVIWRTKTLPQADFFSYTTGGHSWLAHEWLAQLSIYAAYAAAGYAGLMLWLVLFAAATFVCVFFLCRLWSENALSAFMGALVAWFFGTVGLAIRPLLLGHLLVAVELLILELGARRSRLWWWLLPPLFCVWVNSHGSYYFGIIIIGIYWTCSYVRRGWAGIVPDDWRAGQRKHSGIVLVFCCIALCINPVGLRLLWYPLDTLFRQPANLSSVQEWFSPDLLDPRTIGMLGAVAAVLIAASSERVGLNVRQSMLVAAVTTLAFRHARMLFLFGLIAGPTLSQILNCVFKPEQSRNRPVLNAAVMLILVATLFGFFPTSSQLVDQVRKVNPVRAVEHIERRNLSGPMLNEYLFGGYLIWSLPREQVFIDGRGDVFDWTGVTRRYVRWARLEDDPVALLDTYGVRLCLLSSSAPIARVLPYLPGWRKEYADDVAVVFVR